MRFSSQKYWPAFFGLLIIGIALRSNLFLLPMNDEALYATFAVESHVRFDSDANPEHPPFAKWVLGLPVWLLPLDRSEFLKLGAEYAAIPPVPYIEEFARTYLPPMRLVSLVFSILLALSVWFFARKWVGEEAALVSLFVLLLSPNLLLYANAVMLETVFLFFFTTSILFYLFRYREQRTWLNRLLLCLLLFLAMSAKFYGFLAVGFVAAAEGLRFVREKKLDGWLFASLLVTLAAFLAFSYPLPKILYALDFYSRSTAGWTPALVLTTLSRLELISYFLLAVAVLGWWKKGKRDSILSALLFLLGLLAVSVAFNPYPFFRHALVLWPFLALVASWAYANATPLRRKAAWALGLLLFLEAFYYAPYYDAYGNGLGLLLRPAPVERAHALGANAFLKSVQGPIVTNDPYSLPFSFEYDARFVWHLAFERKAMANADVDAFAQALCFDSYRMESYLWDGQSTYLAKRKDGLQEPKNCPALDGILQQLPLVYSDAFFDVYKLR